MTMTDYATCGQMHMGPWMVKQDWLTSAVAAWKAGMLPQAATQVVDGEGDMLMTVTDDGVAVIDMVGAMTKGKSSFGGASTVQFRQALRAAVGSPDVHAIVLRIDSPGGTVAGTAEAATAVTAAMASLPVLAHIEDLGASAALWVAAQVGPGNLSANRMGLVGSIGAIAVLVDASEAFERDGVFVIPITSEGADLKAAGMMGAKVTEEQIEEFQALIDDAGAQFVESVAAARGVDAEAIRALRGRVMTAPDAKAAGLIDHVRSFDETLAAASELAQAATNDQRMADSRARRLRMGG